MSVDLLVDVTAEDLAHGVKSDCGKCPIALATIRAASKAGISILGFRGNPYVSADGGEIIVGKLRGWLPESAVRFMEQFDAGEHVDPFQFNVTLSPNDEDYRCSPL